MIDSKFETPMMQQYMQLKKKHADCFLFFRLGDFYELFLDDAIQAADILNITLTARSRGKDGKIPMAGVPYHAASSYIATLVNAGHKVAICDQVSEPDGKGIVDRRVTRIITPGTITDLTALEPSTNNYLAGLCYSKKQLSLALCDVSTGQLFTGHIEITNSSQVLDVLNVYQPSELVYRETLPSKLVTEIKKSLTDCYVHQAAQDFFSPLSIKQATQLWKKLSEAHNKNISPRAKNAVELILSYVATTQQSRLHHFDSIEPLFEPTHLVLDTSSVHNLELISQLNGNKQHSLFSVIKKTVTPAGSRLLKHWLLKPLLKKSDIEQRHDVVDYLLQTTHHVEYQKLLKETSDIQRLLSRISLNQGTPRDLHQLANTLSIAHQLQKKLNKLTNQPSLLQKISSELSDANSKALTDELNEAITDEPPTDPKKGSYIQTGIHAEFDRLQSTVLKERKWFLALEAELKKSTTISTLKIKYNKVFGYYIEVSKSQLDKVPDSFIRKQTLVNAERFFTPEMKLHEVKIVEADEKMLELQYQFFIKLVEKTLTANHSIQKIASALSMLDCLLSFAALTRENNLTRPTLTPESKLTILNGRHLVVESLIGKNNFVPNSIQLSQDTHQIALITGPNMAGKSVVMRQTAILVLLAHMGCFLPAEEATIPLTDRIFVRSGAADNISKGQSTFMVEMAETAQILKSMTDRSFIIMDEIGRGTSTYDGISIAWAVAEYIQKKDTPSPLTLFATHYHELQELASEYPKIHNFQMAIDNTHGNPVFLYTLEPGGAAASFGVVVAELANLPPSVTQRAQALLGSFASSHTFNGSQAQPSPTHTVASHESETQLSHSQTELLRTLRELPLETTTPLEALNQLATIQRQLRRDTH